MKKLLTYILFLGFFCVFANNVIQAKSGADGFDSALATLNLTPEQQLSIDNIRKEHRKQAKPLKENLQAKQEQLKTFLNQDSSSDEEINNLRHQINQIDGELTKIRKDTRAKVKSVLTEEQNNKLIDLQFKR